MAGCFGAVADDEKHKITVDITSKYTQILDTSLVMAGDTISGYIQGLIDDLEFKHTAYALMRLSG